MSKADKGNLITSVISGLMLIVGIILIVRNNKKPAAQRKPQYVALMLVIVGMLGLTVGNFIVAAKLQGK